MMDGRRTWTFDIEAHWDCVTRSGIEWKRERERRDNFQLIFCIIYKSI